MVGADVGVEVGVGVAVALLELGGVEGASVGAEAALQALADRRTAIARGTRRRLTSRA